MELNQDSEAWVRETINKIVKKMKPVTERNRYKIPYIAEDGVFNDYSEGRYTGGQMDSGAVSCGKCTI